MYDHTFIFVHTINFCLRDGVFLSTQWIFVYAMTFCLRNEFCHFRRPHGHLGFEQKRDVWSYIHFRAYDEFLSTRRWIFVHALNCCPHAEFLSTRWIFVYAMSLVHLDDLRPPRFRTETRCTTIHSFSYRRWISVYTTRIFVHTMNVCLRDEFLFTIRQSEWKLWVYIYLQMF